MGYNKELEDRVDHFFISNTDLTKNKEMDGVGWLVNGNFCCGIYEDLLVVRIEQDIADSIIEKPGIKLFDPDEGRDNEVFISIVKGIYTHDKALQKFLTNSYKLTNTLPPKNQSNPGLS